MAQLIGVVLAGGSGRRMGRPKGDLVLEGRPLADRAARTLAPLCGSVLVSIGPGGVNPTPAFRAVEDAPPAGRGPLSGLAAVFAATRAADLLVLACDYPWVSPPLLKGLLSAAGPEDELVFFTDGRGRDHPLVGLWTRRAQAEVDAALGSRVYKVRALLAGLRVHRVRAADMPDADLDEALRNVNEPADLDEASG